jgi:hypothetical protein
VLWYYDGVYEDLWVPDYGSIRWRRHLDVATGDYQYQRTNTATKDESAWAPVAALGEPTAPGEITAANAPTRLLVENSQEALDAYQWLRELTGALAARLLEIRNKVPALQQAAGDHYENVNYLVTKDEESYQQAQKTVDDEDRTRLIRLGVKLMLDPHAAVFNWAQHNGALGIHQQPILALTKRGKDLGEKLFVSLQ